MTSSKFIEACRFAIIKHATQRRKAASASVVPYVVHTLEAAQILTECGIQDEEVLIAAVLHDTLEDTDTKPEDLKFKFGDRVLSIVQEVTDDPTVDRAAQKRVQVAAAAHKSYEARLVKCADKTSNMRDLVRLPPGWTMERTRAYALHAREVVAQLEKAGGLPQNLLGYFWQASTQVLDWVTEQEFRAIKASA